MSHLFVVEDEHHLAEGLRFNLEADGHTVALEENGTRALQRLLAAGDSIDAVILDVMLPGLSGFDVVRGMRDAGLYTPVLMLTARGRSEDVLQGFEAGADDYLPKPFEPRELLARVKALLRRAAPEPQADDVLRFGRLEIDLGARQARLEGRPCDLTSHQFELLAVLARSPGRVLSRDQIMDALKGHPLEAYDRSIDVHVSRIRAAIEDDPRHPRRVLTVRGAGYVFARKQDAAD